MAWVWVFGATSTLGKALARLAAADGHDVVMVGRARDDTEMAARDLTTRFGVRSVPLVADATRADFADLVDRARMRWAPLSGVVWAFGLMGPAPAEAEPADIRAVIEVNLTACIVALETLLPSIQREGFIAILGSVAADRGRRRTYVYGAAKAGLGPYVEGLRHRLRASGPRVTLFKLGPVRTKMTQHMTGLPFADAVQVAARVMRRRASNRATVYVPGYWRYLMFALRSLPERLWFRIDG